MGARLLLNAGIPDWILDVTQMFLLSPLRLMMRPILQNMQLRALPINGSSLVGTSPSSCQNTSSPTSRSTPNPSNLDVNPLIFLFLHQIWKMILVWLTASVKSNSIPLVWLSSINFGLSFSTLQFKWAFHWHTCQGCTSRYYTNQI